MWGLWQIEISLHVQEMGLTLLFLTTAMWCYDAAMFNIHEKIKRVFFFNEKSESWLFFVRML